MIHIYTDDNETVFYSEKIEYVSELVDIPGIEKPIAIIFVQFTPKNGPARGLTQRIPINQVSSVVDASTSDAEGQAAENAAIALAIRVQALRQEIEDGDLDEYMMPLMKSIEYRQSQLARKSRA